MKSICKKEYDKFRKTSKNLLKRSLDEKTREIAKMRKRAANTNNATLKHELERLVKSRAKTIRINTSKSEEKKAKKMIDSLCKSKYCNPKCKETWFVDSDEEFEKGMKKIKDRAANSKEEKKLAQDQIDYFTQGRKDMFEGKSSVLNDNFYKGLSPYAVKKLRNEGAISGCIQRIV
jgi:hypothetical protein